VSAFSAQGQAFTPASQPRLTAPGSYKVALFLHDTPSDKLEIAPMLIGPDGSSQAANLALVGRTEMDPQGSAKVVFEFKPPQLAAGSYQLQLTVRREGAPPSQVSMPFTVE
jgi:hypothetical protein